MRCGLPASAHGTGDELEDRRAAAGAALAGFRREDRAFGADGALARRVADELQSLLGLLEAGAAPGTGIAPHQRVVLGQAIADALIYRSPAVPCTACDEHPAGLCEDHASDLDRTDAYLTVARDLGIEVER
jgi:hypothetical protein